MSDATALALRAEAATWLIEDEAVRAEKLRRERMRHPKLIRDLLLDVLGTHDMDILEVGGGPLPLSDLLTFKSRVVIDPLADEYRKIAPCPDHVCLKGEEFGGLPRFDLAITTNALDHVESPYEVAMQMARVLRPGGYLAVSCPENNALTHPHPAHVHNLTADLVHRWLDHEFETCWELNFRRDGYRYGWVSYEGKRGQPAFALLMRKCVGYAP